MLLPEQMTNWLLFSDLVFIYPSPWCKAQIHDILINGLCPFLALQNSPFCRLIFLFWIPENNLRWEWHLVNGEKVLHLLQVSQNSETHVGLTGNEKTLSAHWQNLFWSTRIFLAPVEGWFIMFVGLFLHFALLSSSVSCSVNKVGNERIDRDNVNHHLMGEVTDLKNIIQVISFWYTSYKWYFSKSRHLQCLHFLCAHTFQAVESISSDLELRLATLEDHLQQQNERISSLDFIRTSEDSCKIVSTLILGSNCCLFASHNIPNFAILSAWTVAHSLVTCESLPCENGATCLEAANNDTFVCLCRDGYFGLTCSESMSWWWYLCTAFLWSFDNFKNARVRNISDTLQVILLLHLWFQLPPTVMESKTQ